MCRVFLSPETYVAILSPETNFNLCVAFFWRPPKNWEHSHFRMEKKWTRIDQSSVGWELVFSGDMWCVNYSQRRCSNGWTDGFVWFFFNTKFLQVPQPLILYTLDKILRSFVPAVQWGRAEHSIVWRQVVYEWVTDTDWYQFEQCSNLCTTKSRLVPPYYSQALISDSGHRTQTKLCKIKSQHFPNPMTFRDAEIWVVLC